MLRLEGLRRRVGRFALRIDEWSVDRGRFMILVGPSGAGKTMLLEMIAGLHPPDEGRIWIEDREVTHRPVEDRGIGFVYQDPWLFPHLTVRQNIDFGRRYHRRSTEGLATTKLAEMLGISHLLDRQPRNLSGGEKQRVALARALAIRPQLLFLDEPLANLDPVTRERVAAELTNCHRSLGTTILHVTHDHSEARLLGDSVSVMLDGRLEQSGPRDEVFRRPRNLRLARFLGCENVFEIALDTAAAGSGKTVVSVRPEDVVVRPANDEPPGVRGSAMISRGTIVEVSDRGPLFRLVVESEGRRWIGLVGCGEQREYAFRPGDQVRLSVESEAIHIVSEE